VTDPRPWTHAALFGALWGALELTVGTALMLARIPFHGVLMGVLGLLCLVTLRRLQPRPGVCLLAGVVAIFLKVFTIGGLFLGPLVGIAAEALIAELAFTMTASRRVGAIVSGALVLLASPVQLVIMVWLLAGPEALGAYVRPLEAAASWLGLDQATAAQVVAVAAVVTAGVGAVVGAWSWRVAGRVSQRLGAAS